ncbi:hypothetical protein LJR189_001978 [Acidovorax delafieldii]|uniref:hypothetical protein n=1 Tax=Acidovorax delafieldii TaxID=47920 RepID=UPI003ECDF2C3
MTHDATCNAAFRRHHMGRLLHRIGTLLPQWLNGPDLVRGCRDLEQLCWRELGYPRQPVFDGDLPPFLMVDADGYSANLSMPTAPAELAARMAALEPPPLPPSSLAGKNFIALARLLNLTQFELQWLLWSYCTQRFGSAILPVIPLRDATHGCNVLALLAGMPMDAVQDALASRRLYAWGFLDGRGADGEMPSLLSGWLSATDHYADWIEQPYASDSDLLTALCQAQVSLMASR